MASLVMMQIPQRPFARCNVFRRPRSGYISASMLFYGSRTTSRSRPSSLYIYIYIYIYDVTEIKIEIDLPIASLVS